MEQAYEVFLSYSHLDEEKAEMIADEFWESGITCFRAKESVRAGETWEKSIREALVSSKRIVLLMTENSINSPWVNAEAGAGWAMEKELVPALWGIDEGSLVGPISQHQAIKIDPKRIERFAEELIPEDGAPGKLKSVHGLWTTPNGDDNVYFYQKGDRFIGLFNHGGDNNIVGVYLGVIKYPPKAKRVADSKGVNSKVNPKLDFSWTWLNGAMKGTGDAELYVDYKANWIIEGDWCYSDNVKQTKYFRYRWISTQMPVWVDPDDIAEFLEFLEGSVNAKHYLDHPPKAKPPREVPRNKATSQERSKDGSNSQAAES